MTASDCLLHDLALKHDTDKAWDHGFTFFYDKFLRGERDRIRTVVELGIYRGASLKMWRDYFPSAQIYGLDIEAHGQNAYGDRIHTATCDATQPNTIVAALQRLGIAKGSVALFTADGGHTMQQQQNALATLWDYMAPKSVFIMEDLHTSLYTTHQDQAQTWN